MKSNKIVDGNVNLDMDEQNGEQIIDYLHRSKGRNNPSKR